MYKTLGNQLVIAEKISAGIQYAASREFLNPRNSLKENFTILDNGTKPMPSFLQINKLPELNAGDLDNYLFTLQSSLLAFNNIDTTELIFLITNNDTYNKIYLGTRCNSRSSSSFLRSFKNFFEGIYTGAETKVVSSMSDINSNIIKELENLPYATAFTGIPSNKKNNTTNFMNLTEKLLSGLNGESFAYLVIAKPLSYEEINDFLTSCRELLGQLHSFDKVSLTAGYTEGSSIQKSTQQNYGSTQSYSSSHRNNSLQILNELKNIFLDDSLFNISSFDDHENSSESIGASSNFGNSESRGLNTSNSTQLNREYINCHIQAAMETIQNYIKRFNENLATGLWDTSVYLLTSEPETLEIGSIEISSLVNGKNSFLEPVRHHKLSNLVNYENKILSSLWNIQAPEILLNSNISNSNPLGNLFSTLSTPLTLDELIMYVHFPNKEVPGVKISKSAPFSLNIDTVSDGVHLGNFIDYGKVTTLPYTMDIKSFSKHVLVTGINGSGKSTTCRKILNEMLINKKPFLVIEPAKDEYVQWAIDYNNSLPNNNPNKINIYIPGCNNWHGHEITNKLKLNPFEIIWLSKDIEPNILTHIDTIKTILNASMAMQDVLPILMEEFLYYIYENGSCDWVNSPKFGAYPPTISGALIQLDDFMKSVGYEEKVNKNISSALKNRLTSLTKGWKGDLFNSTSSNKNLMWNEIFNSPTIINLSYLGDDDDKSLAMSILLQFLYEYRQSQVSLGDITVNSGVLNHLTVIEEAHRIMSKVTSITSGNANAKGKVASLFSNMLSEIRAYGEGFLIADQVPERLISDAIKNTNTKIVHRLVALDDISAMSHCMGLNEDQSKIINKLKPGQAIVNTDLSDEASWVKVNNY